MLSVEIKKKYNEGACFSTLAENIVNESTQQNNEITSISVSISGNFGSNPTFIKKRQWQSAQNEYSFLGKYDLINETWIQPLVLPDCSMETPCSESVNIDWNNFYCYTRIYLWK